MHQRHHSPHLRYRYRYLHLLFDGRVLSSIRPPVRCRISYIQPSITSLLLLAYVSMPTYCIRSVRITARTAITRSSEKRFPFPCVNEYVHRQLLRRLKGDIVFVPDSDAKLKVMIDSVVSLYLSYLYSSAPQ